MLSNQEETDYEVDVDGAKSDQWIAVAIRVAPGLAIFALAGLALALLFQPDDANSGETAAVGTEVTLPPATVGAGGDGVQNGGLSGGPFEQPELFVQSTAVGEEEADDGSESTTSTETSAASSTTGVGDASTSSLAEADQATTDRQNAEVSTTVQDRTTAGPTATERTTAQTNSGGGTAATTIRPTTVTTAATTTAAPTTTTPTTAAPTINGNNCNSNGEFERIFRDDFNGSSIGGSWNQFQGDGNRQFGLRRRSANSVSNGNLVITAQNENGGLVSGGMSHNVDQTYGKYVVRVRTDNDPSQAVSGVVLTWPRSQQKHRDGENNIYETLVKTPNRNPFFSFIHKPFGNDTTQESRRYDADGSQFQTMTMEWTPDRITITRDGPGAPRDVWTVNETSANLIPDAPHRMHLQLDGWKDSISGTVRMQVDYVEIHKYCG